MELAFTKFFSQVAEANKMAVKSALRFNEIAMETQRMLARQQVAVLNNCLAASSKQIRLTTETRDPKELVTKQFEVVNDLGEKLVKVAQESLAIQAHARNEMIELVDEGVKAVQPWTAKAEPKSA